jgi:hypothetical protein
MDAIYAERLKLGSEQLEILAELLESERTKLLVEIRHTDHRSYRDQLRHRLAVVEQLLDQVSRSRSESNEAAAS